MAGEINEGTVQKVLQVFFTITLDFIPMVFFFSFFFFLLRCQIGENPQLHVLQNANVC